MLYLRVIGSSRQQFDIYGLRFGETTPHDNLPDTLQDGISHLERRKHTLGGYISNLALRFEASKFRQSRSRWNSTGWIDVSCWPLSDCGALFVSCGYLRGEITLASFQELIISRLGSHGLHIEASHTH